MGKSTPFVMMSYDSAYLYLAGSFPRVPGMPTAKPIHKGRRHDADLSRFDRLSLFLDLDRDYATYYSLHIDQRGLTADSCFQNKGWNPKWILAVDGDEKSWRFEAAIPWKELTTRPPHRGTIWAAGLVRTIPAIGLQSWTHPAGSKPRPESFGLIKFE
ncbi:MAG: hypothetical protein IID45_12340 [Planctomycetes bacterium]|nr:hypothetical protein [Planctomycetota bacterium]